MKSFKRYVKEHIVRSGGGFELKSHKGKNLGKYSSRAGALKRERQVEYFKHHEGVDEQMSCAVPNSSSGSFVRPSATQKFVWSALRSNKFGSLKQAVVKSYLKHHTHHSPIKTNESGPAKPGDSDDERKRKQGLLKQNDKHITYRRMIANARHGNADGNAVKRALHMVKNRKVKKVPLPEGARAGAVLGAVAGYVTGGGIPGAMLGAAAGAKIGHFASKAHREIKADMAADRRDAAAAAAKAASRKKRGFLGRLLHREEDESLSQRIARQRAAREARDGTPDEVRAREKVRKDAFHKRKHAAFGHALDAAMGHIKKNPDMPIHDATRMMRGLNRLGGMKYRKGK